MRRSVSPSLARLVIVTLATSAIAIATHSANSATSNSTSTADPATATSKVLIDAGGSGGTDSDGNTWQADSGYTGGTTSKTTATISGTSYQSIFQSERAGMTAYHFAVSDGTYYVKLLESEHTYSSAGSRVFDVTAESKLVEDNLDVYKKTGAKNKAVYVVFTTTVSDGTLNLGFTASHGTAILDGLVIEPQTSTPNTPPAKSLMWGMQDSSSYDSTETSLGRKFALAREYRRIDQSFTSSRLTSLANSGHSLVLSVRADTASGGHVKYADITAGHYDTTFLNGFKALNALKTKTFFIFQHEPESNDAKGSCSTSTSDSVCGPQFASAFQHLYSLAKSHGYTRLIFAVTLEAYSFNPLSNMRGNYYWPGTSYTDWVGIDVYNSNCTHSWWDSFTDMLSYPINWLKTHAASKSIILPEWGAQEGPSSSAKPNFFSNTLHELTQPGYSNIKAMSYWNNTITSSCNYRINTTSASNGAYKTLGSSAAMQMAAPV
jgi:hypothetical protein